MQQPRGVSFSRRYRIPCFSVIHWYCVIGSVLKQELVEFVADFGMNIVFDRIDMQTVTVVGCA